MGKGIDREKLEKLFYEIKDLGVYLELLASVVQNPDFAHEKDLVIFKEDCKRFESRYKIMKEEVEELFKSLEVR